jgi:small-conductance mechanosensitive channel
LAPFLRAVVRVAAIIAGLPLLGLLSDYDQVVTQVSSLFILGAVTWLMFQIVGLGERFILGLYDVSRTDNLRARQNYTQVHILKRTLHVIITVVMLAAALMIFDQVRSPGASILASAGVIGIILGFAARRTTANLFAGFQLALTQPIRIDDVVIVENEWGRIKDITLTYVVVRTWDLRRLIVPLRALTRSNRAVRSRLLPKKRPATAVAPARTSGQQRHDCQQKSCRQAVDACLQDVIGQQPWRKQKPSSECHVRFSKRAAYIPDCDDCDARRDRSDDQLIDARNAVIAERRGRGH